MVCTSDMQTACNKCLADHKFAIMIDGSKVNQTNLLKYKKYFDKVKVENYLTEKLNLIITCFSS